MSKVKKYGIIALMLIVSGFSIFLPIYIWPKDVDNEFQAVMYTEGSSEYSTVAVEIDGHMNKRFFGGIQFIGKVKIKDLDIPEDYMNQNIRIKFTSDGLGVLIYLDESGSEPRFVKKGYIYMPLDISEIAVSLLESEDIDNHRIEGSVIIAGPATEIAEAKQLAEEKLFKLIE